MLTVGLRQIDALSIGSRFENTHNDFNDVAPFGSAALVGTSFVEGAHVLVYKPVVAFDELSIGNGSDHLVKALGVEGLQLLPRIQIVHGQHVRMG